MKLKTLSFIIVAMAILQSCNTTKTELSYMMDLAEVQSGELPIQDYNPIIKPDDELFISITSSVPEATALYNLPMQNPATLSEIKITSQPQQQTYLVDSKGDIDMPVIGKIHVAGMTTEQLKAKLTEIIQKDVKDAMVRVDLVNFRVVVAGEVNTPKTVDVNRQRFSILDAINAAGDLTPYGERKNVLIIREEDGKRVFAHLDLNSSEILTSPYFYLKQNDYIYVEPNEIRRSNAKYDQNNSYKLTVVSTIVSAASVIASLVIALTVK